MLVFQGNEISDRLDGGERQKGIGNRWWMHTAWRRLAVPSRSNPFRIQMTLPLAVDAESNARTALANGVTLDSYFGNGYAGALARRWVGRGK